MKLRFTLVDKSQTGISKYCPSFAKVKRLLETKVGTYLKKQDIRLMLLKKDNRILDGMLNSPEVLKLVIRFLRDKNPQVSSSAASYLSSAAEQGLDISCAIEELRWLLRSRFSEFAAFALLTAVKKGVDISIAIEDLGLAVKRGSDWARNYSTWALGRAVAHEKTRDHATRVVTDLLNGQNPQTRNHAVDALNTAVSFSTNLSDIFRLSKDALSDDEECIRNKAAGVLGTVALRGFDISSAVNGLVSLLRSNKPEFRENCAKALTSAAIYGTAETRHAITKAVFDFQSSELFMIEAAMNSRIYLDLIAKLHGIMHAVRQVEQREVA